MQIQLLNSPEAKVSQTETKSSKVYITDPLQ